VGAFQSLVFTLYLDWVQANDPTRRAKFWQRNYYEHVVRSEHALQAIRQYIADNPARWHLDRLNPDATGRDPQARALWEVLQSDQHERLASGLHV